MGHIRKVFFLSMLPLGLRKKIPISPIWSLCAWCATMIICNILAQFLTCFPYTSNDFTMFKCHSCCQVVPRWNLIRSNLLTISWWASGAACLMTANADWIKIMNVYDLKKGQLFVLICVYYQSPVPISLRMSSITTKWLCQCLLSIPDNIGGSVQERSNSSALAKKLGLSCANPSIW